ncbi:thiamine pyrophosphate-binding protein [Streptomyces sp. NBC_00063]|uniref:thiamine pyrophosphate-binding protein n=1 Tax=Streptomyces sp. NBC_00063 TaxID=2975638 RepID=UPI003D735B5E
MTSPTTVSEAVADVVAQHSDTVFSLMGNGNAHFVSSLTHRGHRVVNVRHETATVIAAQSYFLATGKIPAASTTYGAGYTNMLTSLAEARLARIPMVVVVGAPPTTGPRGQDIDQVGTARALYVHTLVAGPGNAPQVTRHAYEVAVRDRVPVIVSLPYDVVDSPVDNSEDGAAPTSQEVLREKELQEAPPVGEDDAAAVAEALARAERPLILAGRGSVLSGAGPILREIGDRVGALFATSLMAHRIFDSPWDIGIAGGFSSPGAAELMCRADVVLVAGASLNLYQMRYNKLVAGARAVIQIDTQASATHEQVTSYHRADARDFAEAVLKHLPEDSTSDWRSTVTCPPAGDQRPHGDFGSDGRLDPRTVMDRFESMLPAQRTITQDTGHFMGWAARHLTAPDPQGMMLPGLALQSIGLGVGSALGIAVGREDRLPVLVTGDGGLAMELNELDTLVREVKSALVIVLNDAAYGMEVHQYGVRGLDTTAMVFDELDFARIATAVGAQGAKIRTVEDLEHVRSWIASGAQGVFVADVAISADVVADWLDMSNAYYASTDEATPGAAR